jgi:hypothetical protein
MEDVKTCLIDLDHFIFHPTGLKNDGPYTILGGFSYMVELSFLSFFILVSTSTKILMENWFDKSLFHSCEHLCLCCNQLGYILLKDKLQVSNFNY